MCSARVGYARIGFCIHKKNIKLLHKASKMPQFSRFFSWLLPYPYPNFLLVVLLGSTYWLEFSFFHLVLLPGANLHTGLLISWTLCALYCLWALIPSCLIAFDLLLCFDFPFLHLDSGMLTVASVLGTRSQGLPQDCLTLVLNPFPLSSDLPQLSRSWSHDTLP